MLLGINLEEYCVQNNMENILDEWDYKHNGNLIPSNVAPKSNKIVYWKCKHNHIWLARIADRTSGKNCSVCAGKTVLFGFNDLKTLNPILCEEWNYERNKSLKPEQFTVKSGKEVWWKCSICGYEWLSKISNRSNGSGCPNCANIESGKRTIRRQLNINGPLSDSKLLCLEDWDYQKNIITPSEINISSNKKVWWKCHICGYEWEASPNVRSKGHRCPQCVENDKISSIQRKTQDYLLTNYKYDLKHEKDCSISPKNPRTNYTMFYDNEIIISNDKKLIIEVNGEQHYKITEYVKMDARKHNITPQKELEYLQWKDLYKKQYALENGYYYLVLPYWTFNDESYKTLIDKKIQSILTT